MIDWGVIFGIAGCAIAGVSLVVMRNHFAQVRELAKQRDRARDRATTLFSRVAELATRNEWLLDYALEADERVTLALREKREAETMADLWRAKYEDDPRKTVELPAPEQPQEVVYEVKKTNRRKAKTE